MAGAGPNIAVTAAMTTIFMAVMICDDCYHYEYFYVEHSVLVIMTIALVSLA